MSEVEEKKAVDATAESPVEETAPDDSILSLQVGTDAEGKPFIIRVSKTEAFQEIKQYISDYKYEDTETCFSIKINDQVLPSYGQLYELGDIDHAVLETVLEPYTEIEVNRHINKVRDLLAFPNDNDTNGTNSFATIRAGETAYYDIEGLDVDSDNKVQASALKEAPLTAEDFSLDVKTSELVPSPLPEKAKAVHTLHYSQWNPPPAHLTNKGHISYLQAATLDGQIHHIVAHTSGFYVSNSTAHWFDPSPKVIDGEIFHEHSLFTLLKRLSHHVTKTLEKNQATFANILPQAYVNPTTTFLHSPWLTNEPTLKADLARTQENLSRPSDLLPAGRDWNDEFQSARELEKDTFPNRLLRERLLNKISFEFAQAATHGILSIIEGSVQPLNPLENPEGKIYLHEGIFYSFAADPIGVYAEEGGELAARYSVSKDLQNHNFINRIEVQGLYTVLTTIVDYAGHRVIAQAPVPGIFRQLPEGETQVKYGTIDNNVTIGTDESFVDPLSLVAEAYHLKKHAAFDNSGKEYEVVTPSTLTGVVGTDSRKYILDLQRLTPLDLGFLDKVANDTENPYVHLVPLLRPEAIDAWWRQKAQVLVDEKNAAKKAEKKPAEEEESKEESKEEPLTIEERVEITRKAIESFTLNPDVPFDLSTIPESHKEQYEKDAAEIRSISSLVVDKIIPRFVEELKHNYITLPFDGAQLTSTLHKRGINMRYLGEIAKGIAEAGDFLKTVHSLIIVEIVSRSAKHVINGYLAKHQREVLPYVVAQIFNALLGFKLNAAPQTEIPNGLEALYSTEDFDAINTITVDKVREQIVLEANRRFRYQLSENWIEEINLRSLFREISLKVGLQWKGRDYDFAATEPYYSLVSTFDAPPNVHTENVAVTLKSGGKKKKGKKAVVVDDAENVLKAPAPFLLPTLFHHTDVLNIVPIVKHSTYKSSCAEDALEAGRIGYLKETEKEAKQSSLTLLNEAVSIYEQVYGPVHIEVARAYTQLALIYQEIGEPKVAREHARKAVILFERCVGVDSAETLQVYQNLAIIEHSNGNTAASFALFRHVFKYMNGLWSAEQPDTITIINNLVTMLQPYGLRDDSLHLLRQGLEMTKKFFGDRSAHAAAAYFHIAQFELLTTDIKKALESMKLAHSIFEELKGAEDPDTIECKSWADNLEATLKNADTKAENVAAEGGKGLALDNDTRKFISAALRASSNRTTKTVGAGAHHGTASVVEGKKPVEPAPSSENLTLDDLVRYINGSDEKPTKPSASKKHKKGKK